MLSLRDQGAQVIDLDELGARTLVQRAAMATPATLLLSVHHDSIQQHYLDAGRAKEFAGFSVFVSQKSPAFDKSLKCAKRIAEAMLAAGGRPSLYHAEKIQGENRPLLDVERGLHQFDDLYLLRSARNVAVLLEIGVIVNPIEEQRLSIDSVRSRNVDRLAEAVLACEAEI